MSNSPAFAFYQAIEQQPLTITPQMSVSEAIALMSQTRSSCVLVVALQHLENNPESGSIVGIFTERDVVRVTAANQALEGVPIAEVMTQHPFVLKKSQAQNLRVLLNLFRTQRFRHIPIVDDRNILVGLITHRSIREVLKSADWMRLRQVAEVMTTQVIHAPLNASIFQVTQLMAEKLVSCVVITNEERQSNSNRSLSIPVGIITERDIVQFRALGLDFHATKAQQVMSSPLLPIRLHDSLIVAHEKMRKYNIRRLVVLGDAGELVGAITQTSLLQSLDPIEVDASVEALQQVIEERTAELLQVNQRLRAEIWERQQTEAALRLSELRLAEILDIADDAIISVDEQMRVQLFNQGAEKIFGYSTEEILQQPIDLLLPSGFTKAHRQHIFSLEQISELPGKAQTTRREIWLRRKDRTEFPAEASISKLLLGEETIWTIILRDITTRIKTEEKLRQQMSRERLLASISLRIRQSLDIKRILNTTVAEVRQFLSCDRVIIYRFDRNWSGVVAVESVGPGWIPILGTTITDPCFGESYVGLYQKGRIRSIEDIYNANLDRCHINLMTQFQIRANLVVPILTENLAATESGISANLELPDSALWGLLGAYQCSRTRKWQDWEISLLKQLATQLGIALQQAELYQKLVEANQQLTQLASLDGLTQVANRRRFDEYFNSEWRRSIREQKYLSLILCDVDFFKAYNDTYGHLAGDICLQQVANAIQEAIGQPADLVARYGGEEFVVILPNTTPNGAIYVAQQIRSKVWDLKIHHPKSGVSQYITLSLGVATTIPNYKSSPAELIAAADRSLYQAKAKGRNTCVGQTF